MTTAPILRSCLVNYQNHRCWPLFQLPSTKGLGFLARLAHELSCNIISILILWCLLSHIDRLYLKLD
ncbi:hypothetical protein NC653_031806 [Populus alba x Populus x berolinensis]|uniref:Uncharacterized protein n=1 Tax=Populus alba x Populus x berolinensis TaxID=444605 RepID=A0AAD6Q3X3_9ROSI|nr:hypothetical protein NC653_031806 [Populus alba x Populus x berolinensis]